MTSDSEDMTTRQKVEAMQAELRAAGLTVHPEGKSSMILSHPAEQRQAYRRELEEHRAKAQKTSPDKD